MYTTRVDVCTDMYTTLVDVCTDMYTTLVDVYMHMYTTLVDVCTDMYTTLVDVYMHMHTTLVDVCTQLVHMCGPFRVYIHNNVWIHKYSRLVYGNIGQSARKNGVFGQSTRKRPLVYAKDVYFCQCTPNPPDIHRNHDVYTERSYNLGRCGVKVNQKVKVNRGMF